jgi:uncharacterized membrane protein
MKSTTKSEAQQRVDQIRAFQRELASLNAEDVLRLSESQQQAVDAYHDRLLGDYRKDFDVDADTRAKQFSLGMRIASFLGAIALAASVFFLFYQFWGLIPTVAQVTILVLAPLVSFAATLYIRKREKTGYFAKLMGLVCFATFVLNISMLGQIFNMTPTDNAFLVWALLAFILAYRCDIRLLLAAGIICITGFIAARAGSWSGMYWIYFGERPENFFPAAVLLFFVPQWLDHGRFWGFAVIYRVFALLILFLPILVLANWGYISYLPWDPDVIEGFYQVLGFVFSALAIAYGVRRHWNEVVNTGNTFFVIFLYTKFYDWWWEVMPKYLFFLIIALTAILFLFIFKRLRERGYKFFQRGVT